MVKKGYDGPTWEELAECGHSPKMIEHALVNVPEVPEDEVSKTIGEMNEV